MAKAMPQGKVILANLAGDDAILGAMHTTEKDTNTAYERATQHTDCSEEVRRVLRADYEDERRHIQWIEQQLAKDTRGSQAV